MRFLLRLSLLGILLVLTAACIRPAAQGKWAWGRQLALGVGPLRLVEQVGYQEGNTSYVLRPQSPDRVLAATLVTVVNQRSARLLLLVDEKAAFLEDAQGNQYGPLNPFTRRREVSASGGGSGTFQPLLWGTVEVPQGYQVAGWLFFEVPLGVQVNRLRWEQGDTVLVPFRGR